MGDFDRWTCKDQKSAAIRLFKQYHTNLNEHIWACAPMESYCAGLAINASATISTQTLFQFTGPDAVRIEPNLKQWSAKLERFGDWNNVNALVSLLSYFEIYLKRICTLALSSDPGVIFGDPHSIDGVRLLKNDGKKLFFKYEDAVLSIVKGTWPSRLSSFDKLFGYIPKTIADDTSIFERMRVLRNHAAHTFGRDYDRTKPDDAFVVREPDKLSRKVLQRYMALIEQAANEIDENMLTKHIGEYELIAFYALKKQSHFKSGGKAALLRKDINKYGTIEPRSSRFCSELIAYYNSI
jgi:hypothetical protein